MGSTTLASSEYDVTYSNNTNAGTASFTVTAKSTSTNFTGSKSGTFTIKGNPTEYWGGTSLNAFFVTSTESGSGLTINYSKNTTNIDAIIATKSSNSNVVKGVQID